ncbi:proteasome assembly chaperone PAC2 [Acrasis kona]|uniref:Proteasome assembly chaperone 2 n=1 Tax=Acrasis kona TaxID=1008807 RepID=A0AAW2YSH7_9EUKA
MTSQLFVASGDVSFENKTVILGIPSVGNVGQLALDFLISSFNANRVGIIDSAYILPVVGNDPYYDPNTNTKKGIAHTSAEVFEIKSAPDVLLIIIRAPITSSKLFATEFATFLKESKINRLVVLSSANSSWRMDNMIRGGQSNIVVRCQHVGTGWTNSPILEHVVHLDQEEKAELDYLQRNVNPMTHETHSIQNIPSLPQEETSKQKMVRGVGKELLENAKDKFDAILLLVLCNEGDNTPHGVHLAHLVSLDILFEGQVDKLQQSNIQWRPPSSWMYLFGGPPATSLY